MFVFVPPIHKRKKAILVTSGIEIYRHTQASFFKLPLMAIAVATIFILMLYHQTLDVAPTFLMIAVLLVASWLFGSLTVIVTDAEIVAAFGTGLIKRRIPLLEITSAQRVRNNWLMGWGIRKVVGGWMFNVAGLDAVELGLSKGGSFRIGTDEPDQLLEAITQAQRTPHDSNHWGENEALQTKPATEPQRDQFGGGIEKGERKPF